MSSFFDPKNKTNHPIISYLEQKTWLLIHSSSIVRSTIKKILTQLGAKSTNIFDASTMEDAQKLINTKRPHYIVTNKTIHDVSALPLFNLHMQVMPNRIEGGFFFVSDEISLAEVAWALEYEMDGVIGVPLNGTSIFTTFLKAIQRKTTPTTYQKIIEEAREKYLQSDLDGALDLFKAALQLDKTPFESCAFIGQIYYDKGLIAESISSFEKSISHNPQYFKSLKRLSELHWQEKNYKKAYDINLLIAQNYPIAPERIPELIRLSIINQKYEDIGNYLKIFQAINDPSLQMQHHLAAGLAILGKYFASNNEIGKSIDALLTAYKYANGKYEILKSITQTFQDLNRVEILLNLFDKAILTGWSMEVQILHFQILHSISTDDAEVIQAGEKLLKNNVSDITVHRGIIERSIKIQRNLLDIENLILEASRCFPEYHDEFENLLKGEPFKS